MGVRRKAEVCLECDGYGYTVLSIWAEVHGNKLERKVRDICSICEGRGVLNKWVEDGVADGKEGKR